MASLEEVAESASFHQEAVRLCLRGDLAGTHAQLHVELLGARKGTDVDEDLVERLAGEITALEAQMRAEATQFMFQAVGKPAWKQIEADNPPTEDQLKDDPTLRYDPEAFAIAAMAASMIEPTDATVTSVRKLVAKLTDTQFELLWSTCVAANQGVSGLGESKAASAVLARLRPSSEQPSASASAAASSSAES